ncbi:MAG: hypothetical protein ACI311_02485 [Bacilli bacterium]
MKKLSNFELVMIEYFRNYDKLQQCYILLAFESKSIDKLLKIISFKQKFENVVDFFKK